MHGLANPAYLGRFLFLGLPSVAPYCAPGGVRVVSKSSLHLRNIVVHFSNLKRVFQLGEALATKLAAKITAYTYAFLVNRRLGRPQGKIKELWA